MESYNMQPLGLAFLIQHNSLVNHVPIVLKPSGLPWCGWTVATIAGGNIHLLKDIWAAAVNISV